MNKKVNISEQLKIIGFLKFFGIFGKCIACLYEKQCEHEKKKVYKIEQKYLTFSEKSINITL